MFTKKNLLTLGLLPQIIIAVILGCLLGGVSPEWVARTFATFNQLFSNYLNFCIPLIILGLISSGIADLGKASGRLLLLTIIIAYGSTILSGVFSYLSSISVYPSLLQSSESVTVGSQEIVTSTKAFFDIKIEPIMSVTASLVFAFVLGLGVSTIPNSSLKSIISEFKKIIESLIKVSILPLLPIYIFGIFLNLSHSEQLVQILTMLAKIILVVFGLHVILLLTQFIIAGFIAKKNPLKLLFTMLPAYATALGTQSSAATIPVTLDQVLKTGVNPNIASFVVPLCATIHLSSSMLKIVSCAVAVMIFHSTSVGHITMVGFIFLLAVMMIAAPGVPGGAIMAAIAVLQTVLGFDESSIALMVALYIVMDSFGTAGNVTGDCAIAQIVDRYA